MDTIWIVVIIGAIVLFVLFFLGKTGVGVGSGGGSVGGSNEVKPIDLGGVS